MMSTNVQIACLKREISTTLSFADLASDTHDKRQTLADLGWLWLPGTQTISNIVHALKENQ
jgi:hypothetical protein